MLDRIATAWKNIEAALGDDRRTSLRPPAKARAIATLERALECPLPRELAASLATHDGTRNGVPLWSNECMLGAASIARRTRMMRALVTRGEIAADHWSPTWIPLTDADGDGWCLDGKRVIYFRNSSGRGKVVIGTYLAWLDSIAERMRAEARAERRLAERLADPTAAVLPRRARERLARIDQELPFLIAFIEDWPRCTRMPPTQDRILMFRPIARLPPAEILSRAIERGFVARKRGLITVTAAGRKLHV